jgi:hypothetical protein
MQLFTKTIQILVAALLISTSVFYATDASAQVVINEISPDPSVGEGVGAEWIELFNNNTTATNISGWVVTSGSLPGTMTTGGYSVIMPTGLVMPPKSFLLISNANLMTCNTCDYAGLHTALGVIPTAPTGVADFAAGKADAAFLNLATCGCAVSAAGCTTAPAANTTWVLNNSTAATDGERIGLFNNSGVLVDAVYYELGNQQQLATAAIVTNAGNIGTFNNPNVLTLPAIPNAIYTNLGTLVDGCTSSHNRVPDGGAWGLNNTPSRKASGGNQTTATDHPTPGYKNDYSDNTSTNQQPFSFYANGTIIGDAEDVRTGTTLLYGVPSDFIGGATGNTFATKPASTGNRNIITCTTGGGSVTLKYENYNFQHVEENSVLASPSSGTGSATSLAGSYITIGIDAATPTPAPANSTGTATGTTGWTEQGGTSGLSPGNSSILPDATGKTTLNKTLTLPTVANCEVKTALYNMIVRNYGNSQVCGAGRVGNSTLLNNPVGIGNASSSDCWEGASYLTTLVGKPNAPTAVANTAIICPGRKTDLSATNCTYGTIPANADVTLAITTEFYSSDVVDANGVPTGTLLSNPVTIPAGSGLTVYGFTKVVITPTAGVSVTGTATCYSTSTSYAMPDPGAACALPVELVQFDAKGKTNAIELTWATAGETNSEAFEVERSNSGNANSFEKIGTLKAQGNSSNYVGYKFIDKNAAKGINYYRLKQIDTDGKFEYSKIVNATIKAEGIAFERIYPNPFANNLNVKLISDYSEQAKLIIYDITGKVVLTKNIAIQAGSSLLEIETANLPKGLYNIHIITSKNSINANIVK